MQYYMYYIIFLFEKMLKTLSYAASSYTGKHMSFPRQHVYKSRTKINKVQYQVK